MTRYEVELLLEVCNHGRKAVLLESRHGVQVLQHFLFERALCVEGGHQIVDGSGLPAFMGDVATLLTSPYTIVGLSDGGAHVQFDSGVGFSTRCNTLYI